MSMKAMKPETTSVMIQGVPKELWHAVKVKAATRGLTVKRVTIHLWGQWVGRKTKTELEAP